MRGVETSKFVNVNKPVNVGGRQIESVLGHGGFATVFRGINLETGQPEAVKVFPIPLDEQGYKDIATEAQTQRWLDHPHILKATGHGIYEGHPYITMPVVSEGSLRDHAILEPDGIIPIHTAITHLMNGGDALAYAHGEGVLHRDIKPDNALVKIRDGQQHILLTDWGIAENVPNADATFTTQRAAGTPAYMAPEQFIGKAQAFSDVYSFGGMLGFWLATGRTPFVRDDAFSYYGAHIQPDRPTFEEVLGKSRMTTLHDALEVPTQRAMQRDPEKRPQSMEEYLEELNVATSKYTAEQNKRRTLIDLGMPSLQGDYDSQPTLSPRGIEVREPEPDGGADQSEVLSVDRAKEILGEGRFFGPEEIERINDAFKTRRFHREAHIEIPDSLFPFTEAELDQAKRRGGAVVLFPAGISRNGEETAVDGRFFKQYFNVNRPSGLPGINSRGNPEFDFGDISEGWAIVGPDQNLSELGSKQANASQILWAEVMGAQVLQTGNRTDALAERRSTFNPSQYEGIWPAMGAAGPPPTTRLTVNRKRNGNYDVSRLAYRGGLDTIGLVRR